MIVWPPRFVRAVADAIKLAADAKMFTPLVLCAPLCPLGLPRQHLSEGARQLLSQVFAKG